jgi:hypothetical protein
VDVLNAAADEIKRLRKDLQVFEDGYSRKLGELAEGQAREAKLREALNVLFERYRLLDRHLVIDGCVGGVFGAVKEALALPTDDTVLQEVIRLAKREALLEAAEWFRANGMKISMLELRRMAEAQK